MVEKTLEENDKENEFNFESNHESDNGYGSEFDNEKLRNLENEKFDILINLDFFEIKINKEKNNCNDISNYFNLNNFQFDYLLECLYHKKNLIDKGI